MLLEERFEAADAGAIDAASKVLASGLAAVLQFAKPPYSADQLGTIDRLCLEHGTDPAFASMAPQQHL